MPLPEDRVLVHLSAQYAIAQALAESTTLEDAARRLLSALGETMGFEFGALWQIDDDRVTLFCVDTWQAGRYDCSDFDYATRKTPFTRGIGLPGRVMAAEEPVWIPELQQDEVFSRGAEAARCGLTGGFCFPLASHGVLQGAIEFYTTELLEPDDELLELLTASGRQIALFIERVRAEAAVTASESLKSGIFEAALDCIVTMAADGTVVDFNKSAEETFGYERDAILGQEMCELIIPPDLRELHREGLRRYLETGEERVMGQRLELRSMRSDGSQFPIELTVSRLSSVDGPPLFVGFIRDISHRREIEAELGFHNDLLEALDASSLEARLVISHDSKILGFNRQFSELWGIPPEAMIGKSNEEALRIALAQVVDKENFVPPAEELIDHLESKIVEEIPLIDGRTLERYGALLGSRDEPTGRIWFFREITERKRREEADRFLAEAGRLLTDGLDVETTLQDIADTAVPLIADWCVIDLLAGNETRRVAEARSEAAHDAAVEPTEEGDQHRERMLDLGFDSAMVVPIRTGSEVLGGISLATTANRRGLDERDHALTEELAQRIATAIQNARLFAERTQIADTLQRGLLPPDLPGIKGAVLSARFRPVGQGVMIGGDFYDVFALGDDSWGMVIGDVCGKGPEAASLTALVRYTLRAVAGGHGDAADTLRLVNSAMLRQRGDLQFCTAAYGVLSRSEGGFDLELVVAGHPPPMLVRNGECKMIGEPGSLLGIHEQPELHVVRQALQPGDVLVLHTDGLADALAPATVFDDETLCAAAVKVAADSPSDFAGELDRELVGDRPARDDVAVLAIAFG